MAASLQPFTSCLSVTGRESPFHTWRAVEMILCGVWVARQDKGAWVSLNHRALLVVQDVLDQAACRLVDVCVFLREEIKEGPCKGIMCHTRGVALWMTVLISTPHWSKVKYLFNHWMVVCTDTHGPLRMHSTDFVDLLIFHLVPPGGWHIRIALKFAAGIQGFWKIYLFILLQSAKIMTYP